MRIIGIVVMLIGLTLMTVQHLSVKSDLDQCRAELAEAAE